MKKSEGKRLMHQSEQNWAVQMLHGTVKKIG